VSVPSHTYLFTADTDLILTVEIEQNLDFLILRLANNQVQKWSSN